MRDGVLWRDFEGDALWITEGVVRIGARVLDNLIPLELDEAGSVDVEFVGAQGQLTVAGAGLRIEPIGEGVHVERFPGSEE